MPTDRSTPQNAAAAIEWNSIGCGSPAR
ncbi:hypothetical protein L598_003900000390, partial [Mesorhizobium sp. J18]